MTFLLCCNLSKSTQCILLSLQDIILAISISTISIILTNERAFDKHPLLEANNHHVRNVANLIICLYCAISGFLALVNLMTFDSHSYQNFISKFRLAFELPFFVFSFAFTGFYLLSMQVLYVALTRTGVKVIDNIFDELELNPMYSVNEENIRRLKMYFGLLCLFVVANIILFADNVAYASLKFKPQTRASFNRRNSVKR